MSTAGFLRSLRRISDTNLGSSTPAPFSRQSRIANLCQLYPNPAPVPKFRRIQLDRSSQIPYPVNTPESRAVFWSNPGPVAPLLSSLISAGFQCQSSVLLLPLPPPLPLPLPLPLLLPLLLLLLLLLLIIIIIIIIISP